MVSDRISDRRSKVPRQGLQTILRFLEGAVLWLGFEAGVGVNLQRNEQFSLEEQ